MSAASQAISNEPILLRQDAAGVTTLTLNRPGARNALSVSLMSELQAALASIAEDKSVRVVVLAANGPVFCAGHDLKEITANPGRDSYEALFRQCSDTMLTVTRLPQPVIARIQGTATAAGCQLVATCDLAVAADTAKFQTPGVHIGLFCSTPMVALSRNVGRKQAMDMLLTGEAIDADAAVAFGLVNRAVPAEGLDDAIREYTARLASKSPAVLAIGKEAFYRQLEMGIQAAYDHASQVATENMLLSDAEEGISAFVEKRDPVWRGA